MEFSIRSTQNDDVEELFNWLDNPYVNAQIYQQDNTDESSTKISDSVKLMSCKENDG